MRKAAASARDDGARRETPVSLKRTNGSQIEGIVDLAFHESSSEFSGWTVVDFKTEKDFDAASDQYVSQVRMYSEAVAAATLSPTRGVLLVI
jgi:hypothetical protein